MSLALVVVAGAAVILLLLVLLLTRRQQPLPDYADPDVPEVTLEEFLDESVVGSSRADR